MQHYRHRFFLGSVSAMVVGGLLGAPVLGLWGEPVERQLGFWWVYLLFFGGAAWYWSITVRYLRREVVVDDDGLWIDGELELPAAEIRAVSFVGDPFSTMHLCRVEDGRIVQPGVLDLVRPSSWRSRAWWRIVDLPRHGQVAIPREHDSGRGSALPGVVVTSRRPEPRLPGARTGWIIGTYRRHDLAAALLTVAPHAAVADPPIDR